MKRDPEERFLAKVNKTEDCWQWLGGTTTSGYGNFWTGERQQCAHRWAYEKWVGPIPAGLQIDHLCRNRGCVRPDHLEAVTPRVNTLRGTGPAAQWAARTHCEAGHKFTPENTTMDGGARRCRKCRTQAQRDRRAARAKAEGRALQPANTNKTHCKRGHEFTPENTYIRKGNGARQCKSCGRGRGAGRRGGRALG